MSAALLLTRADVERQLTPGLSPAPRRAAGSSGARWSGMGPFIAAVGADNEDKQEIDPQLLAHAKVVTDLTAQACMIGDLHHAIAAGLMTAEGVHAGLGEVVAGLRPGRADADETIVFDSTGTGLQDVAAAIAVYRSALRREAGVRFDFAATGEEIAALSAP
jgi:ornithine cyclodeaminase/alanine dehydrogenase-like protein (mu-crystallin family)